MTDAHVLLVPVGPFSFRVQVPCECAIERVLPQRNMRRECFRMTCAQPIVVSASALSGRLFCLFAQLSIPHFARTMQVGIACATQDVAHNTIAHKAP